MSDSGTRPYVWMLCGSFSFTLMAELAQVLTRGIPGGPLAIAVGADWQTAAIARSALAALFATVMVLLARAKLVVFRPKRLWVRSVAGSCSMVCTFFAFANLPAADVLTLTNTFPLWVAVLCWPLYGQVPDAKVWVAVGCGIVGVALIEQPHLEAGNWGAAAALAAAGFTAVAMLGLHSLHGVDPRAVVLHFSAVATLFSLAAFLVAPRSADPARLTDTPVLLMLLGLGLAATVGQLFLTLAFGRGAPAKVSVVGLSQVVFALVFDVYLWGRTLNAAAALGTFLVLAPTAWLLTRPRPRKPADLGPTVPAGGAVAEPASTRP